MLAFTSMLALLDKTIIAMMGVPFLAIFLVGSLTMAVFGIILSLKESVREYPRQKKQKT